MSYHNCIFTDNNNSQDNIKQEQGEEEGARKGEVVKAKPSESTAKRQSRVSVWSKTRQQIN